MEATDREGGAFQNDFSLFRPILQGRFRPIANYALAMKNKWTVLAILALGTLVAVGVNVAVKQRNDAADAASLRAQLKGTPIQGRAGEKGQSRPAPFGAPVGGQAGGPFAELNLSSDQERQISEIMRELPRPGNGNPPQDMRATMEAHMQKVKAVLTPDQKKKFEERMSAGPMAAPMGGPRP